jgi:hypothetical protein
MGKYLLSVTCICAAAFVSAQDSIRHRVIVIGDAGSLTPAQQHIIKDAATRVISGKTTVVYLGNNIFRDGFSLTPGHEQDTHQDLLRSQFQPMRSQGAHV